MLRSAEPRLPGKRLVSSRSAICEGWALVKAWRSKAIAVDQATLADPAGGQPAGIEILLRALAGRRRAEARGFDRLEQTVVAERAERRRRDVHHIDRRFRAADHLFDLGERAVIDLGRDAGAGFLGERLEIGDLLRLPVGAAPGGDAERVLRPRAGGNRRMLRRERRQEPRASPRRRAAQPRSIRANLAVDLPRHRHGLSHRLCRNISAAKSGSAVGLVCSDPSPRVGRSVSPDHRLRQGPTDGDPRRGLRAELRSLQRLRIAGDEQVPIERLLAPNRRPRIRKSIRGAFAC